MSSKNENSIFDVSNQSDEIVSENDLPCLLEDFEKQGLASVESRNYAEALQKFKRAEEIMETVIAQGGVIKNEMILSVLHNTALCYQETKDLKNTANYIEACFFNTQSAGFLEKAQDHKFYIKKCKFIAKVSIEYSFLMASFCKTKNLLKPTKVAYESSCRLIKETLDSCNKYHKSIVTKGKPLASYSKSKQNKFLLAERALPTLESLNVFINHSVLKKTKIRSALGIKSHPDWSKEFSIENISKITPICSTDFIEKNSGSQSEFTKDSILYKIALLAVSMYFMGIYYKSIKEKKEYLKFNAKAFQLIKVFFPKTSPIYEKIKDENENSFVVREDSGIKHISKVRRNKSMSVNPFNNRSSFELKPKKKDKKPLGVLKNHLSLKKS